MRFEIRLPIQSPSVLLDIRRDVGDKVRIGDILFSYEADGALLFEYSAYNGVAVAVSDKRGERMMGGETVMVIEGDPIPSGAEMFPADARE